MKKYLLLPLLGFTIYGYSALANFRFDFHHLFGRCEGSDYCRICTNCSRCGYCKGGGTCGVCYTPRAIVRRSAPPRTHSSRKSISANHVHSIDSRSSSVKRYYLRKSSAKNASSSKLSTGLDQTETESFSTIGKTDSDVKNNPSLINQTETADNSQSVYAAPDIPEEKESFTIDIPENAEFVRVTASSAHLREQFSTKSRILQKLGHGDLLIKIKSVKGWVKVQALDSGEVGYVFGGLIK